jgi:thymidylate kinase
MPLILGERSIATSYATKWSHSPFRNWLNFGIINLLENKIKTPDYVIYIDVPHDILKKRIETRDKERDMDDSVSRLMDTEKAYLQIMNTSKIKRMSNVKWIQVSGVGDSETIGENILELITQLSDIKKHNEPLIS